MKLLKRVFVLILFVSANLCAQARDGKITIIKKNASLVEVFQIIEKQTDYLFFYDKDLVQRTVPIDISVKNATIDQTLEVCLKDNDLIYSIVRNVVVINSRSDKRQTGYYLGDVNGVNRSSDIHRTGYSTSYLNQRLMRDMRDLKLIQIDIRGRVVDEEGNPLVNASIVVKGSNTGTSTDQNGNFSISVADPNAFLIISFTGFAAKEVKAVAGQNMDIVLFREDNPLTEVVVTALGIERERKALGYSVTEVKGEDLTQVRETNLVNSLVGKVAGLNVSSISGGPGASSNVIIRGISSLGGTNQPLYVINGVPMQSSPNGVDGGQFSSGPDRGDAIGDLNPDDIESISVLKGASAAALYGSRAKAGVILITTKSASSDGIEFSSSYLADQIIDLTDFQYVYGQGQNNVKPTTAAQGFETGQRSWGGLIDGSMAFQADGVERPYVAHNDNLSKFYRTGRSLTNTIAFNKVIQNGSVRLSATDLTNNSVMPNSGLNRQSFSFSGNYTLFNRLLIDARVNYILEQGKNRASLGDTPGNANYGVLIIANTVNIDDLKATKPDGSEQGTSSNVFATNPWFAATKFTRNTNRNRLISSVSMRYNFDNGLFVQGRVGRDFYDDRYTAITPNGTASNDLGSITEQTGRFFDLNVDGLVGKDFHINNKLTISPNLGASYRQTTSESISNNGSDFSLRYIYNLGNTKNKTVAMGINDQEVQSVYGTLDIDYGGYLFLHGTGRNDWFSTLATPGVDNKLDVFYPSVSASFVFSEFLKKSWLTFGKLRLGYAVVGQATGPYQTQLSYSIGSTPLNGMPVGSIATSSIPNRSLRPSKASEFEIGTEIHLFNNRVGIDMAWYTKTSKDEIISAPASITSGYNSATLNIGEMINRGFEALVNVNVFRSADFSWTTSLNGSINKNKVISLAAGQSVLLNATSRSGVGFIYSMVGLPAAQVTAFDYKYDHNGEIVLDNNGIPARGDLIAMGSAYPKWVAGWNNDISYKRFNLAFLIDGKFGGKIYASMNYNANRYGLLKRTVVDREKNFGTGSTPIDAMAYYTTFGANVSKQFVEDASFIKFRQIAFGYNFPVSVFNNKIKSIRLSLVGRNLFWLMRKTENIDPEGNYSSTASGLTQGLENGGLPPVRSYGVNLNVKF